MSGDARERGRRFRMRWQANRETVSGVWAQRRRLAEAMRAVVEGLVTSDAPEAELAAAATRLEEYATHLAKHPKRESYVGFAEAVVAQQTGQQDESARAGGHFDFSPLIGRSNPLAPPVVMTHDSDGTVYGRVTFGAAYEGPPGCVHGGYVAAAFDEVLGYAETFTEHPGMTGTLEVIYKKPTPLHKEVVFTCKVERVQGRKIFASGTLYAGKTLCAEANAVFIGMREGTFLRLLRERMKG